MKLETKVLCAVLGSMFVSALLLVAPFVLPFGGLWADRVSATAIQVTSAVIPPSVPETESAVEGPAFTRIYDALPADIVHSGHMLFFKTTSPVSAMQIARRTVRYTHYLRAFHLESAIRQYNGIVSDPVPPGRLIFIPHSLPMFVPQAKNRSMPPLIEAKGLYFTGSSIGNDRVLRMVDSFRRFGINTVVFDAKDITGIVNYHSNTPEAQEMNTHERRTIDNVDQMIRYLKRRGIYVIARIAAFHDHLAYRTKPSLAIRSRSTGRPWSPNPRELWLDPTNREAQDYTIGLAVELAEKGVDEIQFDYIRFPTTGNIADMELAYHFGRMSREEAIKGFLKRAYGELSKRNVRVSIDIFGVVAWGKAADINSTGQRIEELSKYCDVISPMLYPSHFSDNFDGFANPGDHPYHFIYDGCKRVMSLAGQRTVRPWLQAFRWRVSSYGEDYILKQVKASRDCGASGYLFWNAANNYDVVLRALSIMEKNGTEVATEKTSHGQSRAGSVPD